MTITVERVLDALLPRLGLESKDVAVALRAALLGHHGDRKVTVVDNEKGDRWVVLGTLSVGQWPEWPLLVRDDHLPLAYRDDSGELSPYMGRGAAFDRLRELGWLDDSGRRRLLSTREVAEWFRGRAVGVDPDDAREAGLTWAPAARDSFAPVTLAGDLGAVRQVTPDVEWESNAYGWWDLNEVPAEGSVWRLSARGTLWVFTRGAQPWEWLPTCVPGFGWPTCRRGGGDFGTLLEGALAVAALAERHDDCEDDQGD